MGYERKKERKAGGPGEGGGDREAGLSTERSLRRRFSLAPEPNPGMLAPWEVRGILAPEPAARGVRESDGTAATALGALQAPEAAGPLQGLPVQPEEGSHFSSLPHTPRCRGGPGHCAGPGCFQELESGVSSLWN